MKRFLSLFIATSVIASLVVTMLPIQELPTLAAPGDWAPEGGIFPHSTGISRGTAAQIQPDSSVGTALTPRTINTTDLTRPTNPDVYACDAALSNNKLSEINNNHYFPDGIGFSSFNNYRNEFAESVDPSWPPNDFFDSDESDEVERNYLGGASITGSTAQAALGENDAKDTVSIDSVVGSQNFYLQAYVHNSASTALNPTGDTDPRSASPVAAGSSTTFDISARAVNTRMHFSLPATAVQPGQAVTTVNRLRANNAYHEVDPLVATFINYCAALRANQVSDIATIENNTAGNVTFWARRANISNPYLSEFGASHPNRVVEFSPTGLSQLVNPVISQAAIADPTTPVEMSTTDGAAIASGTSDNSNDNPTNPGINRNVPNQIDLQTCTNPTETIGSQVCNAYSMPTLNGSGEFNGQWYGSREFSRNVFLYLDAVAADPELSVSKHVRLSTGAPTDFTSSGPTSVTMTGNGDGTLEYLVLLQNTGNVDLDNVNFDDILPPELVPAYANPAQDRIIGQVSICSDMAGALDNSACSVVSPHYLTIPLTGSNRITLNSASLGITPENPLQRDPAFISTGEGTEGEVLSIRFYMSASCDADDTEAVNYAVSSAESNGVDATITTTLTPHVGGLNVNNTEWETFFPGHSLNTANGSDPATNDTTVTLVPCATPDTPSIRIGKYVRQLEPNADTTDPVFGTGAVSTTIPNPDNGVIEYAILVQNNGTGAIDQLYIGDYLPFPGEMTVVSGSIRVEYCVNEAEARAAANCTVGGTSLPNSAYNSATNILATNTRDLDPLDQGQFMRLRWQMTTVCVPGMTTPPAAENYGLVLGWDGQEQVPVTLFPDLVQTAREPYNINDVTFGTSTDVDPSIGGYNTPAPTNTTIVNRSRCDTPPPGLEKSVSTVARGDTPVATTFVEARDESVAVDFGQRNGAYTVHYRIAITNGSDEATLENVRIQDRFFYRNHNGATASVQNIVQPIGAHLSTYVVDTATNEESFQSDVRRVIYTSNSAQNILTFTIPTLLPEETLAFYYDIVVDPGERAATQVHRNEARVCFDEEGPSPAGACTGSADRVFHQDIPEDNPLELEIIKRVNGHDANEASLTATGDQAAVQVNNNGVLNYSVVVTAPSSNTDPVTDIELSDTVGSLAGVSNITNVRLITTGSICTTVCTLSGGLSDLALSSRHFDLEPGDTATLTYDAVAIYTNGTSFMQNIATATPDPDNDNNPDPVDDPATIIVRRDGITVQKTVNGADANTDQTAVTVNSDATLNYVVVVRAATTNVGTVTGAVIADNVTTLPNVTNIRNITLQTPGAPCASICTLTSISQLSTYSFNLAVNQSATLRYTATGVNTTTTTSTRNRNDVTVTTTNTGPASDPAIIFVRGEEDEDEPETDFRINKVADPTITRHGNEVTYTIEVEPRNSRNDEIDDLTLLITDDINDNGTLEQGGVTFTYIRGSTRIRVSEDADCEGEMDDEDGIRCEDVSPDEEIRITYRVRVSAPNLDPSDIVIVENTARLRSDTPGVRIRDDDDAEVQVIADPRPDLPPEQFLQITKNVSQREVRRGQTVTYTIQVHNPNNQEVIRTLVDTIGLNGGTVPGQNGGRVRFNEGTLQIGGAQFSGSISNPTGMVLIIPALGTATITYTATGEPEANQRVISLAPNTATLNSGEYATAFVELPKTGPVALGMTALGSLIVSGTYFISRRKKK